ncbi:MAG: hypothetical protein ABIJ40_10215 [Bacteroidota bacterium]
MLQKIKNIFTKKVVRFGPLVRRRTYDWQPKVFILNKELPGIHKGARFQQSYQTDNVYFYGIPINGKIPQKEQVGIIQFEARHVENNPEWFTASA